MAARTFAPTFGSFALDSTQKVRLGSWRADLLKETRFESRLKADGAICTVDRYDGQEIEIEGDVYGEDSGETTTQLEALLGNLARGEDHLKLYSDRRILCRLSSRVRFDMTEGGLGKVYRWSAQFRSRFPTWEAVSATTDTESFSGAGPHTISLAVNAATAPIYPEISIENTGGAFSNVSLNLMHTGNDGQISIAGLSMEAGETIVLDFLEGQLGDGTSISKTPHTIEANWFPLVAGAANSIELSHTIGAGASLEVVTTWRDQFWSM